MHGNKCDSVSHNLFVSTALCCWSIGVAKVAFLELIHLCYMHRSSAFQSVEDSEELLLYSSSTLEDFEYERLHLE